MSVRVDLLRPEERQLYSAVGRSFIIKVAAMSTAALLAFFTALALYNVHSVVGSLGSAREQWGELEGPHAKVMVVKDELDEHRNLEHELSMWSDSRVDWLGPLQELQTMVPTNIQLTALNVSSKMIRIKGKRKPGAALVEGKKEEPPDQTARVFHIRLDGKAFGEMADHVVTRFVDDLQHAPTMETWLDTLGLQGLQRGGDQAMAETEAPWIFRVEAESEPRILR